MVKQQRHTYQGNSKPGWGWTQLFFFPSNAFMASARSLHTFKRSKKMNCNSHAGLSTCRKPQKCWWCTCTQSSEQSPQENTQTKKTRKQQKTSKKKTQQQQNQNKNNTEKWDRNQQWELHAWWHLVCHYENGHRTWSKRLRMDPAHGGQQFEHIRLASRCFNQVMSSRSSVPLLLGCK